MAQAFVAVPRRRDLTPLIGDSGVAHSHHGLGSVYSDLRIIEATWRLLEAHGDWLIPEMNRHLVERSVHSEALAAIVAAGGQAWQRHEMQMIGQFRAQARQAQLNVVDWTQPYAEMSFPDMADQHIATRLGEGDRRVKLPSPVMSPFGNTVTEFVLPCWLVPGVPSDAEDAEAMSSAAGVTRFGFGGRAFVYDRHGLRPDQSRPKEVSEDDGP
jgi:CRISPR-associated endonuclease/helicase Cas3